MIYGELGLTPITVDIQARKVSYWSKLLENDRFKLTSAMYTDIFRMHRNGICKSKYIYNIKSLIEKNGFSGIWLSQNVINSKGFPDVSNRNLRISKYNLGQILLILHQVEPIVVAVKTDLK